MRWQLVLPDQEVRVVQQDRQPRPRPFPRAGQQVLERLAHPAVRLGPLHPAAPFLREARQGRTDRYRQQVLVHLVDQRVQPAQLRREGLVHQQDQLTQPALQVLRDLGDQLAQEVRLVLEAQLPRLVPAHLVSVPSIRRAQEPK